MPRWPHRHALSLTLVVLLTGGASADVREEQIIRFKRMQQQILMSEPAEKLELMEQRRELLRESKRHGKKGAKASKSAKVERAEREREGKAGLRRRPEGSRTDATMGPRPVKLRGETTRARLSAITAPPNRIMNDKNVNPTTPEPDGSCQSEVSIAANGSNVVATWNDGYGIFLLPIGDTQGFGYSTDGGLTWTDGGPVPNNGSFLWSSDPVVVVNEKTNVFYYCGLIDNPNTGRNGIAISRGVFSGSTFAWDPPVVVRDYPNNSNLIDKQWMAVDSLSGNLYMTFSNFTVVGQSAVSNSIQFTRSTDGGNTWSAPFTLSATTEAGLVQGSRPAVGPNGELYTVWHAIGQFSGPNANSPFGRDFFRIRKSTNAGVNFGTQVTAD